jgi:hypothetical protein
MLARVHGALLGAFLLMAGACNALTGVDDLGIAASFGSSGGGADGGSETGSGGSSGSSGSSGSVDGGDGGDGGDAGPPPPNAKVTSCGLNQLCLPNADGWTPVAYLPLGTLGNTACPTTYPTRADWSRSGGGGCACNCAPVGGSCAGSVDTRSGLACGGAPTNLAVVSGTCTDLTATLPIPVAVSPHLNGAPPASCTASVSANLPRPTSAVTCSGVVGTMNPKCDVGELCVPKAGTFGLVETCIVHDGEVACPKNLGQRTVIATKVDDSRSCGTTCSCATASCSNGATLEAFSGAGCRMSVRSVSADGSCTSTLGMALSGASYRYTAGTGCGVTTQAAVLGSVTYTSPRTLCCTLF